MTVSSADAFRRGQSALAAEIAASAFWPRRIDQHTQRAPRSDGLGSAQRAADHGPPARRCLHRVAETQSTSLTRQSTLPGLVLFNGSNSTSSQAICACVAGRHGGTDHRAGRRAADMRSALVDCRGRGRIATGAGERYQLQFYLSSTTTLP
jgi:hypothetical protein